MCESLGALGELDGEKLSVRKDLKKFNSSKQVGLVLEDDFKEERKKEVE